MMSRKLIYGLLWLLMSISFDAYAVETMHPFASSEQEALYQRLITELRCLVCQNQNIADSDAELAADLRQKTYELINQGNNEAQIKAYMQQRYGDFVLYSPPLNQATWLLWCLPFLLLLAVLFWLFRRYRAYRAQDSAS
jgi:cytochrome c-type biogenesis protein CcmH